MACEEDANERLGEFGLTPEPGDPLVQKSAQRVELQQAEMRRSLGPLGEAPKSGKSSKKSDTARKVKNKRKAAKASRTGNKRKKLRSMAGKRWSKGSGSCKPSHREP